MNVTKPFTWALEHGPDGGVAAHRREWLLPSTVLLLGMTALFSLMALGAAASEDMAGVLSMLTGAGAIGVAAFPSCLRQKSLSVRGPLAVATDRLWPRARKRVHRLDTGDIRAFSLFERKPPPGESRATFELHAQLQDGTDLKLVSELRSLREAQWLLALATKALEAAR